MPKPLVTTTTTGTPMPKVKESKAKPQPAERFVHAPASPEIVAENQHREAAWHMQHDAQRRARETQRREQEEHRAAHARHRERADALLAQMAQRWPAAFTTPVPLAVGIHRTIRAALRAEDPPTPWRVLRLTLMWWASRTGYLQAVAAGGSRVDLDGQPCGQITDNERERATAQLQSLLQTNHRDTPNCSANTCHA